MPRKGVIVGFDDMGQLHFRNLKLIASVEIVAVVDTNESQRRKAINLGLPTYPTLDTCKEAKTADFFIVSVSIDLHFFYLQIIMQHYNKPIFVEKPVVKTIEEACELERLAKTYPHPIFVGDYNPRMREFLAMDSNPSYLKISHVINWQLFNGNQTWLRDKCSNEPIDLIYQDLSCLIGLFGKPTLNKVSINQQGEVSDVGARLQFRHFEAHINVSQVQVSTQHPTMIEIGRRGAAPLEMFIDDYLLRNTLLSADAYHFEFAAFMRAMDTRIVEHPLEIYLAARRISNHIDDRIRKQQQFATSPHVLSTFQMQPPAQPAKSSHLTLVKDEPKRRLG